MQHTLTTLRTIGLVALAWSATAAAAGPGAGTDLTPAATSLWIHADAEYGAWLSSVQEDGTDPYAGWGPNSPTVSPPGLGWVTTSFPLVPAPQADILLDDGKPTTMEVWVGGGAAGHIFVTPTLLVNGDVLAAGEELEGTFLDGGLVRFGWDLTTRLDRIPAGAEVEWQFRLSGAYESAFYWMEGDAWTVATLPVIAPEGGQEAQGQGEGSSSTSPPTSSSTSTSPTPRTTTTAPPASTAPTSEGPSTGSAAEGSATQAPETKESPSVGLGLLVALALLAVRRRL